MIACGEILDEDSVVFAALPLFHTNALLVTTLAPLLRGQHVVWAGPLGYRDQALFGDFWKIVERYRISAMSGVPTVYSVLAQLPIDAEISSLKLPIVSAAPLPAAVRDAFEGHTGVSLCEGYGLTEGTCASSRSWPVDPPWHRRAAPALSPQPRAVLDTLDATVASLDADASHGVCDLDGRLTAWLAEHGAHAVLVRPDFYVFGSAASPAEVPELLDDVRSQLSLSSPASSGAPA